MTEISVDLTNRTCLVTGATAGIGKEVARNLARMGATVVLACRSLERGQAARDEIARDTGSKKLSLLEVDLSSQASIRAAAKAFESEHERLHVLVNNAGTVSAQRRLGADGHELTWSTNVLGYHLLTKLLLERLKASAPARVVNVASEMAGGLDTTDLDFERRSYSAVAAYKQSKQANRMLTVALSERLAGSGVTVNVLHPGFVKTEINRDFILPLRALIRVYAFFAAKTPQGGADTPTWLAASPEVEGKTGKFWVDRKERACRFRDGPAIEALWALCEKETAG
jgi:NAD(P)-dependent dehydrogenase (short-subunit alcohol dehydrogenase family)